jgi:Ca-activated chloride channel family protein
MMRRLLPVAAVALVLAAVVQIFSPGPLQAEPRITGGTLTSPAGLCPLKHTDVDARITGPLARVTVTQEFENPFSQKIEAVYVFPLPTNAAVDDMTMLVGDHTVKGVIKPREEARRIYDNARRSGQVAGLLDQERPNIFTQAVANIVPGAKVKIVISYVETMPYEAGSYEFRFPMVVAPRYIPGRPTGQQAGGWSPDTNRVPDASRITPQVTPEGTRAGHDISLKVAIDSGVPIESLLSKTHDVAIDRPGPDRALIHLKDKAVIPNKDFVLKYDVAGRRVQDAVLTHHGSKGGFFTMILQPPERVAVAEVTPKELVFVLDTSGSMMGFPIEKAKEAMRHALNGLNPRDTFNLITFAGDTRILFPHPVPATAENLEQAQRFLETRRGSGGTEMMKAIRAALDPSDHQGNVRIVCFMTDGEVGNDFAIIDEVKRHPNARVFSFGIGSSVNHFLLDNMARYGRGEVEYVGLRDDGSAAARRFHERVRNPLLTDISIDWGGLPVSELSPARVPDLFGAKPVVISGRYNGSGSGTVRLRGRMAGRDFVRDIRVDLPASQPDHDVLATLWARRKVDDLMAQDMRGLQRGQFPEDLKRQITQLGLDYRLMTQFTSFVAVEERVVTEGGTPRRVEVPVEMPEGMSYEGVFGNENVMEKRTMMMPASGVVGGVPGGVAGGVPGGVLGGIMPSVSARRAAIPLQEAVPPPTPPPVYAAPREMKDSAASPKASPAIASLIARVKAGGRPSVDEAQFVFGDKARVRVTITAGMPLETLRRLGFELTRTEGSVMVGQIAVDKLEALVKLPGVVFVDRW